MVSHAGRLLALNEGDLPYALKLACDGLLETVGRVKLGGWRASSFTAHPKVDPVTGESLGRVTRGDTGLVGLGGGVDLGSGASSCRCVFVPTTSSNDIIQPKPHQPGKLYFFRYTFDAAPYVTAGVLDAAGGVEAEIPLDLPRAVMMHDMVGLERACASDLQQFPGSNSQSNEAKSFVE
jgi:carotenoid cleavage dioxygenase-like enzyme